MSDSPNFAGFAWSISRSLLRTRRPAPAGSGTWQHDLLVEPLRRLEEQGLSSLDETDGSLRAYLDQASLAVPDELDRDEALAFWTNVYNAGALLLAAEARRRGDPTVLRVRGGFQRPVVTVQDESLSLDAIEHAKVRRFGDPRIHAGLVCGSISCPTLRPEPYEGSGLDESLDDQMRSMLAHGGAAADRGAGRLSLSRIFKWYGADFVRPQGMPTFLPVSGRSVAVAVTPWLDEEVADWVRESRPTVEFLPYDWGLACRVA